MAIDLSQLKQTTSAAPARIVFYGAEGTGKTTLAASFPKPLFLKTEDGTSGLSVFSATADQPIDLITSWAQLCEILGAVMNQEHDFQTLVLDSVDWTQELIYAEVTARLGYQDINTDGNGKPAFGHGYKRAADIMRELLKSFDAIRTHRSMNIVLLAHEQLLAIDEPERAKYHRRTVKLQSNGEAVVTEWADMIGHIGWNVIVQAPDAKQGKRKARVNTDGSLLMRFDGNPGFAAKNRFAHFGCPDEIIIPRTTGFEALRPYLPNYRAQSDAAMAAE